MRAKRLSAGSFLLRLDKGDEVISCLAEFASQEKIGFASVSGIGAASEASLAVFDTGEKRYIERRFSGSLEIVSLIGNITSAKPETGNQKPRVHLHAAIAGDGLSVHGGHLISATTSVTCEIVLAAQKAGVERKKDEESGLMLIE